MIHLLGHIAAKLKQACANVALQFSWTENFCDGAGGLPAPEFKLEGAISRCVKALCEEQIRFVLRINMWNAPAIHDNFHRLLKPGNGELFGGLGQT